MATDIRMNFSQYDSLGRSFGVEGIIKALDKYKIESAVLVSRLAVDVDFRLGNKELFEALKTDDRLYGYLVVNPNYPEESIKQMRSAMTSSKFVGLAIFQGASKHYPQLADCGELLNAFRRYLKPVLLHTPHVAAVEAAAEIAREFRNLKFILGSMGGNDWKSVMSFNKQLNLVLDTSGSFDAEKIEEAVEQYGSHKVLFGSEFPFADPASMIALIQSSGLSKDAVSKIFSENARRLFFEHHAEEEEAE